MEVEGIPLQGTHPTSETDSDLAELRQLVEMSATAWRERRYTDIGHLNRRAFDSRPHYVSTPDVRRMLREAGCPIDYVSYA